MLSVWEERKVRLYGEHANVHQSHSQNDSGDLRGVAGGYGELGCLCGKAGASCVCVMAPPIHLGAVVNGYGCLLMVCSAQRTHILDSNTYCSVYIIFYFCCAE